MNDIKELNDEELEKINGGNNDVPDNPKGLKPNDSVYFCYTGIWMWGTFVEYNNEFNQYKIRWEDTNVIVDGVIGYTALAGELWFYEEDIK